MLYNLSYKNLILSMIYWTILCFQGTTEDIEVIFLDMSNLKFFVKPDAFKSMHNLRFLKIYSSNPGKHQRIRFREALQSLPNELRLLHWEDYPLQSLPQHFDPTHLVELNMPYSKLQKLWGGTKVNKLDICSYFCSIIFEYIKQFSVISSCFRTLRC